MRARVERERASELNLSCAGVLAIMGRIEISHPGKAGPNKYWSHPGNPKWVFHPVVQKLLTPFNAEKMGVHPTRLPNGFAAYARYILPTLYKHLFSVRHVAIGIVLVTYGLNKVKPKNGELKSLYDHAKLLMAI